MPNSTYIAFESYLDELLLLIDYSSNVAALKSGLNDICAWERMTPEQSSLINRFFKIAPFPNRSLYNSIYVSSVASFEAFLTGTIELVLDSINRKGWPIEKIESALVQRNFALSGQMLSKIYEPPNHINLDFYTIARNLGTCQPGAKNFTLNTQIASFLKKILDLQDFFLFLKDCKIQITYDILGADATLSQAFGTSGVRETANQIKEFVQDIIKMRNRIAHTGQSASDIGKDEITTVIKKIKLIGKVIDSQIAVK